MSSSVGCGSWLCSTQAAARSTPTEITDQSGFDFETMRRVLARFALAIKRRAGNTARMHAVIRVRMSRPHYAGNLVDGAQLLELFGDVATELCVRADGDEGLFRAYDSVEFLAPVYAGDFIEARGEI